MTNPKLSWKLGALALAGLTSAFVGNACSLVLGFEECTTDADCSFESGNGTCEDGVCVFDEVGDDTDSTGEDTTAEDTTADGTMDETVDETVEDTTTSGESCTTHTECTTLHNENWLCGCNDTCVEAITPLCQIIRWPSGGDPADDTLFVGSIFPTSPPFDTLIVPLQNATLLAIDDFNGEVELGTGQRIGWIACDSAGGTMAVEAADHLVNNVCVPAVVGPVFSESVMAVAEDVTIPGGTFMMTPTGTNKKITNLVDDDLVWRPIASDIYQANAIADRVEAIAQDTDNVVIVHKNDLYGTDLAADAFALMGGSVNITDVFPYDVQLDPEAPIVDVENIIANTLFTDGGNPPEIIVLVGTSELIAFVLGYLQAAVVQQPPAIPRFVFSHGAVATMPDTIKFPDIIDDDATQMLLYSIMEGVSPSIFDPENFAAFNTRYFLKFDEENIITTSSLAYDSALVTLFAMSAIPDGEPITGANIAAQMDKLVDPGGTFISFGPDIDTTFIQTAFNALSTGGTVDLKGVSGELSFDVSTGDVRTDYVGWEPIPVNDDIDNPTIDAVRSYVLNPEPAQDGTWFDIP